MTKEYIDLVKDATSNNKDNCREEFYKAANVKTMIGEVLDPDCRDYLQRDESIIKSIVGDVSYVDFFDEKNFDYQVKILIDEINKHCKQDPSKSSAVGNRDEFGWGAVTDSEWDTALKFFTSGGGDLSTTDDDEIFNFSMHDKTSSDSMFPTLFDDDMMI